MWGSFVLGVVQGVTEWLPVSSEGSIILVSTHFFGMRAGLVDMVHYALWLHLGTWLAAVWYLRKDLRVILSTIIDYRFATFANRRELSFLVVSTLISGAGGFMLLRSIEGYESNIETTARGATLLVGVLLLGTGFMLLKSKRGGVRSADGLTVGDGIILGFTQAAAVLPGLSRSGLTVAVLLLRGFRDPEALRLSFLMSIPIVLAGNIILNLGQMHFDAASLVGIASAAVAGFITMKVLLGFARRVNFGYFALCFGVLTIASVSI